MNYAMKCEFGSVAGEHAVGGKLRLVGRERESVDACDSSAPLILVVEDEMIVARDIQMTLKSLGYSAPAVVCSGEDAVAKAAEIVPDLVLMDIVLKGEMDGIEAAGRISRDYNIPVVYLTAYADDHTLRRARITEPFGYLLKPFEERDLRSTIEIALYRHQMEMRQKKSESLLRHQLEIEHLMAAISTRFINLDYTELNEGIKWALEAISRFAGMDRSYVLLPSGGGVRDVVSHEWCAEGVCSNSAKIGEMHVDELPWIKERLCGFQPVLIPSVVSLPPEAEAERVFLLTSGVLSTIIIPMVCRGELLGSIVFDCLKQERVWARKDVSLMKMLSEIIANALERRRSRIRLMESEERFRSIYESSAIGIALVDEDFFLLSANRAFREMLGYSEQELLDLQNCGISHPDDIQKGLEHFRMLMAGRMSRFTIEKRYVRKGGGIVWCRVTASVILRADQLPQFAVIMLEDVTEGKLAEEEVLRLTEELERRVVERTAQLEVANKELESFSYSVSHDLFAPLRHINGYSMALKDDCDALLNDQGRQYLERIIAATRRMQDLINGLLCLSRVTRAEVVLELVSLSALAEKIMDDLNRSEPARLVEFRCEPNVTALCDPRLMRALLENLLGNSWKYTSSNPAAVIEFGVMPGTDGLIYYVRDNGVGFDMAYAPQLFGAFQRLHRADEFEGNGIGLATVKRIVHLHGGRIWAEGEVGKGATFFFMLGSTLLQ